MPSLPSKSEMLRTEFHQDMCRLETQEDRIKKSLAQSLEAKEELVWLKSLAAPLNQVGGFGLIELAFFEEENRFFFVRSDDFIDNNVDDRETEKRAIVARMEAREQEFWPRMHALIEEEDAKAKNNPGGLLW